MAATEAKDLISAFQACVDLCNDTQGKRSQFFPFSVDGKVVGYVLPSFAETLAEFCHVFQVRHTRPESCAVA